MEKEFEISDVYLASAITIFSELPIEYRIVNHRVLFVFPSCPELYQAIDKFNHGEKINVLSFVEKIKRTRATMLMLKMERYGNRLNVEIGNGK